MPALASKLNPRSEEFKAHAAAMRVLVDDLNAKLAQIALGGGETARAKHVGRGKLLPRERVEMLLDPDAPFLEIAPLAALNMYKERGGVDAAPGAGLIAGMYAPPAVHEPITTAICGMPNALMFAWLKKIRPKCSRSGNTSS